MAFLCRLAIGNVRFPTLGNKRFRYPFPHWLKAPSTVSSPPFLAIDGDEKNKMNITFRELREKLPDIAKNVPKSQKSTRTD